MRLPMQQLLANQALFEKKVAAIALASVQGLYKVIEIILATRFPVEAVRASWQRISGNQKMVRCSSSETPNSAKRASTRPWTRTLTAKGHMSTP